MEKQIIRADLTSERPMYILSAYGPGRNAPEQLFGGQPREQSFEELRLRHYELAFAGKEAQAIQEAKALNDNAEQQIHTALADLDGAIKYITDAENKHPNRVDICMAKGGDPLQPQESPGGFRARSGAFAAASTSGLSGFGKPPPPAPVPAFGKPAFGQAAAPASAFGKPSAPALNLAQSSSGPTAATSAFGQSSTSTPAFGQPSVGQAATPAPAFGQPTSLGQKPSAFSQPSNTILAPAFGQTSTPAPFGQAQQTANPLGGQQAQKQPGSAQQNSPFGQQPSTGPQTSRAFGQQQASTNLHPFAITKPPSAFGQPATALASPPGQPAAPQPSNAFGQASTPQTSTVFGQISNSQPAVKSFGSKDSAQNLGIFRHSKPPPAPTFGQPAAQAPAGGLVASAQATATPSSAWRNNRKPVPKTFGPGNQGSRKLLSWQGQSVTYIDDEPCIKNAQDGGWQKIWFPEGPPAFTDKTPEYPEGYVLDEASRMKFEHFLQHGVGSDGLIPDWPPPREMISWDF